MAHDCFLSYNTKDREVVARIASGLRQRHLSVFLDTAGLHGGHAWLEQLEGELKACASVAVFLGPDGVGDGQRPEVALALVRQQRQRAFPVVPVLLPGATDPELGFLMLNTWVDLRQGMGDGFIDLLASILKGEPPGPEALGFSAGICPFRGLRPFREDDSPFFFGRDEVAEKLESAVEARPLVAVVGASGSGKSSVVRAGLVPRLRARDGKRAWTVLAMVPGERPLDALATALVGVLQPESGDLERLAAISTLAGQLSRGEVRLRDAVHLAVAKPPGTDRLLLIVDQWEELYTMSGPGEGVDRFVGEILDATSSGPLSVVLTLRGDFFGHILSGRALAERLQDAVVNVGPMSEDELRKAIALPAEKVGLQFEAGLVERALRDAGSEPGNLPLLEFLLTGLWERRKAGRLRHEAYEALGGVRGAVAVRAEEELGHLTAEQRETARRLFMRLVVPGGEQPLDTRRRARLDELDGSAVPLVRRLADARLLVTGRDNATGEETVELAHEALIRWPTLGRWLDDERQWLRVHVKLADDARAWQAEGREEGALNRGSRLAQAAALAAQHGDRLSALERSFLEESRRAAAREAAKDEAAHRQQLNEERRQHIRAEAESRQGLVAPDQEAERRFAAATRWLIAGWAVTLAALTGAFFKPVYADAVDNILSAVLVVGVLLINSAFRVHIAGRALFTLAVLVVFTDPPREGWNTPTTGAMVLVAIPIAFLLGAVFDAASRRRRLARFLFPALGLFAGLMEGAASPTALELSGDIALSLWIAAWPWIEPFLVGAARAPSPSLPAAVTLWMRQMLGKGSVGLLAGFGLVVLLSYTGQERLQLAASRELAAGVSAQGEPILHTGRYGLYWQARGRFATEPDLRAHEFYALKASQMAGTERPAYRTLDQYPWRRWSATDFGRLREELAPFRTTSVSQIAAGLGSEFLRTYHLGTAPRRSDDTHGSTIYFADGPSALLWQSPQTLALGLDDVRTRRLMFAGFAGLALLLLWQRPDLSAVRWTALALVGATAWNWQSMRYLEYLTHELWTRALDQHSLYKLAGDLVILAVNALDAATEYGLWFAAVWLSVCWPSAPMSWWCRGLWFLGKLATVALLAEGVWRITEWAVAQVREDTSARAWLPAITTMTLFLVAGWWLRRTRAALSPFPQLPWSAVATYVMAVMLTLTDSSELYALRPPLTLAFCLTGLHMAFRLGILDAGNARHLRDVVLLLLFVTLPWVRTAAGGLLSATPFGSEGNETLVALAMLGTGFAFLRPFLPALAGRLPRMQVKELRHRVDAALKGIQDAGGWTLARRALDRETAAGSLLYTRGSLGAFQLVDGTPDLRSAPVDLFVTVRLRDWLTRHARIVDLRTPGEWREVFHGSELAHLHRALNRPFLLPVVAGDRLQALLFLPEGLKNAGLFDQATTRELSRLALALAAPRHALVAPAA